MRMFIVILMASNLVVACGGPPDQAEKTAMAIASTDVESVRRLQSELDGLRRDHAVALKAYSDLNAKVAGIQTANEVGQFLGEYPEFLLLILDQELDTVERGKEPKGSFTDYFLPIVETAQGAGVSQSELNKRLDRLVRLAKKGKPLSSWVENNPERFADLVNELKKPAIK